MEVSVPGRFHPISILDAKIELLSSSPIRLARKTQVRFHLGTAELLATLKPLAGKEIQPGEKGFARIQLERSILTIPGDRFIFRRLSPMVTLGGGVVLDVEPVKSRSRIEVVESLRSIESLAPHELIGCLAERNGLRGLDESQMLSRTMADRQTLRSTVNQLVNDNRLRLVCEEPCLVMDTGCFTKLIDSIVRGLEDFLHQNPLRMGIPREQIYSSGFKSCHPLVFRAALDQRKEVLRVLTPGGVAILGNDLNPARTEGRLRAPSLTAAAARSSCPSAFT